MWALGVVSLLMVLSTRAIPSLLPLFMVSTEIVPPPPALQAIHSLLPYFSRSAPEAPRPLRSAQSKR